MTCRLRAFTVFGPMLSVIENLLVLQDRDRKIQRLEAELNNIGPERAFLQEKAKAAQSGHEASKNKSKQPTHCSLQLSYPAATHLPLVESTMKEFNSALNLPILVFAPFVLFTGCAGLSANR